MSEQVEQIMALADEFAEQSRIDGFDYPATQSENYSAKTKDARAALRAAVERVVRERDEALSDPMNVGWQHAESARRDRAAALSQWKAAKDRAERAERDLRHAEMAAAAEAAHADEQRERAERAEREAAELRKDAERFVWLAERLEDMMIDGADATMHIDGDECDADERMAWINAWRMAIDAAKEGK